MVLRQDDSHLWDKYVRVLKDGFVSMDMAQNILVIKTVSGMAMAVAAAVDAMKFQEIVGCIAGDDTIMMAVRSVEDTKAVMEKDQSYPWEIGRNTGRKYVGELTCEKSGADSGNGGFLRFRPEHSDRRDGRGKIHHYRFRGPRPRRKSE